MRKKSIYDPVREQFQVLVEYINILELKENADKKIEIVLLIELMDAIKRQCEIYLNYELVKTGTNND